MCEIKIDKNALSKERSKKGAPQMPDYLKKAALVGLTAFLAALVTELSKLSV